MRPDSDKTPDESLDVTPVDDQYSVNPNEEPGDEQEIDTVDMLDLDAVLLKRAQELEKLHGWK